MLDEGLVGLIMRVTVLMALGLVLARLFERRSAALSHRLLTATALCVLLLPVIHGLAPSWEWNCPRWLSTSGSISSSRLVDNSQIARPTFHELPELRSSGADASHANSVATTAKRWTNPWNWASMVIALWMTGTLLRFTLLGYGWNRLRASIARSHAPSSIVQQEVQVMAAAFKLGDRVEIRMSSRDSMPMVCWFGRWILVLPGDIESWSTDVRRAALSHELGHIVRRDVWVDYLIQLLTCLLWWHPLVRMMERTVTRLRELACDEWVLQTCQVSARSYSYALLDVVGRCQVDDLPLATPMATKSELEGRLRGIASPYRLQKVRRFWIVLCAVGIALLGVGIAAIKLVERGSAANSGAVLGEWSMVPPAMKDGGSTITGRVTYEGNPVAGVKVKVVKHIEGKPSTLHAIGTTDDEGRYKFTDMHPGDRYNLEIAAQGNLMVRNWEYQLPYLRILGGNDGDTIELSDAVMVSNTQMLVGVVVDPDGKPVPGISVSANLASGQMLSRPSLGPEPWTQTDQLGRFSLSALPEEPIELMAYKANPAGGRIMRPCKMKVALNAKDIRIVFDPKLGSGIEDLDAQ